MEFWRAAFLSGRLHRRGFRLGESDQSCHRGLEGFWRGTRGIDAGPAAHHNGRGLILVAPEGVEVLLTLKRVVASAKMWCRLRHYFLPELRHRAIGQLSGL